MKFVNSSSIERIHLAVKDISYKHNKNTYGIHPFNFNSESYLFVGIIGSSGVGKTTMLNVLNGNLNPNKGEILLNGHNIHDKKNKELFKGLIGYVPQDDLLIDELTVFQNLYFNAKLCFANYTDKQIIASVENALNQLDLIDIKDLKVGNPLEKVISGGQRKRLNIGLEKMRSPSVLLIDEPTSGLSSNDSINIINLLRELTLQGKLVIVNIHQPSSNIYKFFDQLLVMDNGGRVVYSGEPMEAIVYFKTLNNQVDADQKECPYCGNVNTEIILEIITEKLLADDGTYLNKRKTEASKWYSQYRDNIDSEIEINDKKKPLPKSKLKIPNSLKQFKIFNYRNILTKLENKQYILISLLEAPLLAVILSYFSKFIIGTETNPKAYIFSENVNIPAFFLMSILVAIFVGLLISAEEIIKDRKLLEREKFLNLSRKSYLNSKIVFLFSLSAIQMFTYVIISNYLLQIKGMNFQYWLILYSTICFANMLGLNLSSGLKSIIAIYIIIPFLIMPQILLSGTIIEFDKLHNSLTSKLYPPVIADVMVSRWAYEALAVTQFKNNEYEKNFYNIEKQESEASYYLNVLIPKLDSYLDECETQLITNNNRKKAINGIKILKNQLSYFNKIRNLPDNININKLSLTDFNNDLIKNLREYLNNIRYYYSSFLDEALYKKDNVISFINSQKDYKSVKDFKQMYY
ncbi:MAG: ATP-binding cassette domain-containing protein, partial [Bacteroidales bacterium]|nr:ATP-binding cassette domain-containing protein [Bacteroidales bacterium]